MAMALVNCLAIIISFTSLLINITQWFRLFLKSLMIKINRTDTFHMITPCIWKRTYVWSSYLILSFDHLIKDFIGNWKCSAKETAPWKEPRRLLLTEIMMKFSNSRWLNGFVKFITWLEETHLTYKFVNAFLDRIRWVMLNLWDMFFNEKVPQNTWVSLVLE